MNFWKDHPCIHMAVYYTQTVSDLTMARHDFFTSWWCKSDVYSIKKKKTYFEFWSFPRARSMLQDAIWWCWAVAEKRCSQSPKCSQGWKMDVLWCIVSAFKVSETKLWWCCCCLVTMSDSCGSHGLQPATLLCPWDFPVKNIGVGCHFLVQGIFPIQVLNPHLLHWHANSLPLSHQGSHDDVG